MLTETAARWVLLLHTALGVAAVGAVTHLVIWMRRYIKGDFKRHRAVRRFAWIALVLHACAFLAGNVMYPTYKVKVRAAYLENPAAVLDQRTAIQREVDRIAAREKAPSFEVQGSSDEIKGAAKAARWFDVKEHWVALGLFASLGLVLILSLWDPRTGELRALAPVAFALSLVIAGTVWLAAIVGVFVASWRAV